MKAMTDFNNNEIYDDADLALGGTQVRANNPNIWGITLHLVVFWFQILSITEKT